jgi:hypothetical protein
MARAGQTEVSTGDDSQQIEIGIPDVGNLAEETEHVGIERLDRIARRSWGGVDLEADWQVDVSVKSRQAARALHGHEQRGTDAFRVAAKRTAQIAAIACESGEGADSAAACRGSFA